MRSNVAATVERTSNSSKAEQPKPSRNGAEQRSADLDRADQQPPSGVSQASVLNPQRLQLQRRRTAQALSQWFADGGRQVQAFDHAPRFDLRTLRRLAEA
ncbi:MAG: hypothetical protein QM811_15845 [Pirellulales bacterium]